MEKQGIELLPKPIPSGRSAAISTWTRTVGIPLIIGLQLLFLATFAFRAKLEIDLRNLAPSIEKKESILFQSEEFEEAFRNAQARLELIAKTRDDLCYSCAVQKIEELSPSGVTLTFLSLKGAELDISAEAARGTSFATFVAKILEEETIREAAITSGSLSREGNFILTMELGLNKSKLR